MWRSQRFPAGSSTKTPAAQKRPQRRPVFITDRGRPAHVLLTIEEYQKIVDKHESIVDLLAMPNADEIENRLV